MSDDRLRELERRSAESGSVEDEAAYLSELVRLGMVSHDELELSAYVGHLAARRVLGVGPWRDIKSNDEWREWAQGLGRWGRITCARAFAAAYRDVALPILRSEPELKDSEFLSWAEAMITRLDAWLDHPSRESEAAFIAGDQRCQGVAENPVVQLIALPGSRELLVAAVRSRLALSTIPRDSRST